MQREISIQEALELQLQRQGNVLIDLRSPSEYSKGAIPGAVNIPLFDDGEREEIGLTYKDDPGQARKKGLVFASSRLPQIIEQIERLSRGGAPILYCWRGGLRSKSVFEMLKLLQLPAYRLKGGYKAYRRFILEQLGAYRLAQPLFVLNGLTGVGKTRVLQLLARQGCPVLDLEGLAGHRGSLFGHLGLGQQRSQKDFDALLWLKLEELNEAPYLLVEGEGKRIGSVYQPDFLFAAIQEGQHILLTAPLEVRVKRLLEDYTPDSETELQEVAGVLASLERYLGAKTTRRLLSLLEQRQFAELVGQLCTLYYDRLYPESKPAHTRFACTVSGSDLEQAAREIKQFMEGVCPG